MSIPNLLILSLVLFIVSPQITTTTTTSLISNNNLINRGYGPQTIGPVNILSPGVSDPLTLALQPGQTMTFYLVNGLLSDMYTIMPLIGFTYSYQINEKPDWINYHSENKSFTASPPSNWATPSSFNLVYNDSRSNSLTMRLNLLYQGVNSVVFTGSNTTNINNVFTIVYPLFTTTTANLNSIKANNYAVLTNINRFPWTTFQLVRSPLAQTIQFQQNQGNTGIIQTPVFPQTTFNQTTVTSQGVVPQIVYPGQAVLPQNQGGFVYSQNNTVGTNQLSLNTTPQVTQVTRTTQTTITPGTHIDPNTIGTNVWAPASSIPSQNVPTTIPTIATITPMATITPIATIPTTQPSQNTFTQSTTTTTTPFNSNTISTQPSQAAFAQNQTTTTTSISTPNNPTVTNVLPVPQATISFPQTNNLNSNFGSTGNTNTQTTQTIQATNTNPTVIPAIVTNNAPSASIVSIPGIVSNNQPFGSQSSTTTTSTFTPISNTTPASGGTISFGSNTPIVTIPSQSSLTVTQTPPVQTTTQNNGSTTIQTVTQTTATGTPSAVNNWASQGIPSLVSNT